MSNKTPTPSEINYHQKSRMLEIVFEDEQHFQLSAEYLRVHSPSAEVRGHGPGQGVLQVGKENVKISHIEPVGNYAVCLHFDDGHNTGIYSFEELYQLGVNKEQNWQNYLKRLEQAGRPRKIPDEASKAF
ncbi:MAG: DUF971 domain-containing protein [Gammaproteobacteria bacterium]|jgi:DUF971 family protein